MKGILRNTVLHAFTLFLLSEGLDGVKITGGIYTLLLAGFILSLINMTVKPILSLLTLPFNVVTFGMFSFVTNAFILYLLTLLIGQIRIVAFLFPEFIFAEFVVPQIYLNTFNPFLFVAFLFSIIMSVIEWFIK